MRDIDLAGKKHNLISGDFSLYMILSYVAILNIIDSFATYIGVTKKLIEEANPIMNQLFSIHPLLFVTIKILLSIALFLLLLYRYFPKTIIFHFLAYLSATLYTFVFFCHLIWITA